MATRILPAVRPLVLEHLSDLLRNPRQEPLVLSIFVPSMRKVRTIRSCIQCERFVGECVRCGAEATPPKVNSRGRAMSGTDFNCLACGHHFGQGEGGETGGMCEPCFDAESRRAGERGERLGLERLTGCSDGAEPL